MTQLRPFPSLRSRGRGNHYTLLRGLAETLLRQMYRGGWAGRVWGATPMARRVDAIRQELPILPRNHAPLRLAFVSDLHLGPTTSAGTLERAFELLREADPDVLLLGGDYVFLDATREKAQELTALVRSVEAPLKLAVMGNHDLWTDHSLLERALEAGGAELVTNEARRLGEPHEDITIVGLDEPWTGEIDADRAFSGARGQVTLAVCHSPDGLKHLNGHGPDLFLCGHTHGGQVCLPGPRPLIIPGELGWQYPFGLHEVGETMLFVSRGIGGVEVPTRVFARPDVGIFDLVEKALSVDRFD